MSARIKGIALVAGLLISTSALATAAQATPPGPGPAPNLPTPSNLAEGKLDGPVNIKQDGIGLKVHGGDATVREFDLTYPVGTYSGWHRHPGIVIAVVQSGTVKRQFKDCKVSTFKPGDAFYEVGDHFVWNPDAAIPAVLKITQIFPAGEEPREDSRQRCRPPAIPPTISPTATSPVG